MSVDAVMELLADHVPVTLLLDLVSPPDADELFASEVPDLEWLAARSTSAA